MEEERAHTLWAVLLFTLQKVSSNSAFLFSSLSLHAIAVYKPAFPR
jgi:hypothetical protein